MISGYATLAVNATLSITVYASLQNGLANGTDYNADTTIRVISTEDNNIVQDNSNSLPLNISAVKGCNSIGIHGAMTNPYAKGSSFPLYITFRLRSHTLTNGDHLEVDFGNWVPDAAATGVQVFKYKIAGNIYWVPSAATKVSGNRYKVPVYLNYSMTANSVITLLVDTFAPDTYYGAQVPSDQWNQFKIYAYRSNVLKEQKVHRVWT